jgi:hypothetical protein
MAKTSHSCLFTRSNRNPSGTNIPDNPKIGDVHLDDSSNVYYVYSPPISESSDPVWRPQESGKNFTHPLWKKGSRYTWSTSDCIWKQEKSNIAQGELASGVKTRKKRQRIEPEVVFIFSFFFFNAEYGNNRKNKPR